MTPQEIVQTVERMQEASAKARRWANDAGSALCGDGAAYFAREAAHEANLLLQAIDRPLAAWVARGRT